ncbi:MAG: hypothetical protein QXN55_00015 [Candidatus Nitrosotenuis sp.]
MLKIKSSQGQNTTINGKQFENMLIEMFLNHNVTLVKNKAKWTKNPVYPALILQPSYRKDRWSTHRQKESYGNADILFAKSPEKLYYFECKYQAGAGTIIKGVTETMFELAESSTLQTAEIILSLHYPNPHFNDSWDKDGPAFVNLFKEKSRDYFNNRIKVFDLEETIDFIKNIIWHK